MNPNVKEYKDVYAINQLAFKTQSDIINSQYIQVINPPFPSFIDKKNKRGPENYKRYCLLGNYISSPKICLESALGLINKEQPKVTLPKNMNRIIDYATIQGTDIVTIQNKLVESIFKYGLGLIKVNIPEGISIANNTPRLEVIQGNKVIDYGTYLDEDGNERFQFLVIDSTRNIFNKVNKWYTKTKLYKIYRY